MNYLFVRNDGSVTTGNTITDSDRADAEVGFLDVFQFSCNFMHFTRLVASSYTDEPDEDDEDSDDEPELHWNEDKWEVVK